jgi:hypothetical protein
VRATRPDARIALDYSLSAPAPCVCNRLLVVSKAWNLQPRRVQVATRAVVFKTEFEISHDSSELSIRI